MTYRKSTSTLRQHYNGGVSYGSSNETDGFHSDPSLVKGSWLTFPDGSRFRRPTNYSRYECYLERGSPMISDGYRRVTSTVKYDFGRQSGPGGYRVGNFFSGNWIYKYNSAIGLASTIGAPSFPTMEENEAVTKSLNKIADQKVNLGENLATLGLTMKMLRHPIDLYLGALKRYPKGFNFMAFARHSYRDLVRGRVGNEIADAYLEYVYGFKPLMQDIYALTELAKSYGKKPLLLNGKGSSERYGAPSDLHFSNISADCDEYWENCVYRSNTRTTIWAKLSDKYSFTRTLNQLGLLNPVSLAWELVPYSFVVDWLLPIGPVLSAMSAPAGLDFVGGSTSRRVKAYWDYRIVDKGNGYTLLKNEPATGKLRYNGYNRKALSNWPRPGLWYSQDPLGLSRDGSDRAFKALALSISRIPRLY